MRATAAMDLDDIRSKLCAATPAAAYLDGTAQRQIIDISCRFRSGPAAAAAVIDLINAPTPLPAGRPLVDSGAKRGPCAATTR